MRPTSQRHSLGEGPQGSLPLRVLSLQNRGRVDPGPTVELEGNPDRLPSLHGPPVRPPLYCSPQAHGRRSRWETGFRRRWHDSRCVGNVGFFLKPCLVLVSLQGSRNLPSLSAATLASLGGTSTRRGSGDTSVSVDTEASMREIKVTPPGHVGPFRKVCLPGGRGFIPNAPALSSPARPPCVPRTGVPVPPRLSSDLASPRELALTARPSGMPPSPGAHLCPHSPNRVKALGHSAHLPSALFVRSSSPSSTCRGV